MIKKLSQIWFLFFFVTICYSQKSKNGILIGQVNIDSTWANKIYMSYLPSFEDMYTMSSEMIIAESVVDENGRFEFDLEFLPKKDKLYRLHIPKKSDSKYSLIIGLNNNYLLFVANKNSEIKLFSDSTVYPFDKLVFEYDTINKAFHAITNIISRRDSIASVSDYYKRKFINEKAKQDLLEIADTSSHHLVSLYSVFQSDFDDFAKNKAFYDSYLKKWHTSENEYIKSLRSKVTEDDSSINIMLKIFSYVLVFIGGLIVGKYFLKSYNKLNKLSVQERKVLAMLKKGASNKDISEEFSISISTAKSHVSSILSKMNVKSRKELMN